MAQNKKFWGSGATTPYTKKPDRMEMLDRLSLSSCPYVLYVADQRKYKLTWKKAGSLIMRAELDGKTGALLNSNDHLMSEDRVDLHLRILMLRDW